MSLQGSLEDMTVADLIQHNCLDRKTARLMVENNGQQATLFFKEGAVTDAILGGLNGEEAVYKLLTWQNGFFTLETGYESPSITIERNWSSLLMEGARLLDERNHETNGVSPIDELAPAFQPTEKEPHERLKEILNSLAAEGTDLEGAAVINLDGLIYAAKMSQSVDKDDCIGPTWAEIFGFSRRGVEQFERGVFKQTLIQGNRGNIVITDLNEALIFVGLIPADVSLGIVFSETRVAVEKLRQAL